jgi:hypothetical protein
MTKQHINIGQSANDKSGDPLRTAFDKVNQNFDELFATDTLTKYLLGDDEQFVRIELDGEGVPTGGITIQSGFDTAMPVYIKGGNASQDGVGGNVIIEAGAPPLAEGLIQGGGPYAGTVGDIEMAANQVTIETLGGVTTFSSGEGTPYVRFPMANNKQIAIQGNEIQSGPGTDGIALIAREGSILLATHADEQPVQLWEFDRSGTINTPLLFPLSFTAVLDVEHRTVGSGAYSGPAWEFHLEWQVNPNGDIVLMADNGPLPSPVAGYANGQTFEFTEADHGIPNYTLSIVLSNNDHNSLGYTADLSFSAPPAYPSTVNSSGAIKLTSNENSWAFGTDGGLTFPLGDGIFDRPGFDTGFNIRSNNASSPIYLYAYGTDGDGTGAGNIYINPTDVEIYSNWQNGGAGEEKWTFGAGGVLTLPDGGVIKNFDGSEYGGGGNGTANRVQFANAGNIDQNEDSVEAGRYNIVVNAEYDVVIQTNESEKEFRFTADGALRLPTDGTITAALSQQVGTIISNIEAWDYHSLSGDPYAWIPGETPVFQSLYNRGDEIIGWLFYSTNDPSNVRTITSRDPGGPALTFNGDLGSAPYTAHSPDYVPFHGNPVVIQTNGPQFQANWTFGADGGLSLPGGAVLTSASDTLVVNDNFSIGAYSSETRLQPSHADANVEIATLNSNDVMDPNIWTFGLDGTLTLPNTLWTKTFSALLLPVYGFAPDIGPYGGDAWTLDVTFTADAYGVVSTTVAQIFPIQNNPGYKSGDSYTFNDTAHGIAGYTLTIVLNNVEYPGIAGWTANVQCSAPPASPPTIYSDNAIKISSNNYAWTFDPDGVLTLPTVAGNGGNRNATKSFIDAEVDTDLRLRSYGQGHASLRVISTDSNATRTLVDLSTDRVRISTNNDEGSPGGTQDWIFGTDGILTLPFGSTINDTPAAPGNQYNGQAVEIKPGGVSHNNQLLRIYPTVPDPDGNHLHLTSGDLRDTDLFLGDDNQFVQIAVDGKVCIGTYGTEGHFWQFGTDGSTTFPNGTSIGSLEGSAGIFGPNGTDFLINTRFDNTGSYQAWTFGTDGKLTFPNNSIFDGQTLTDHATGVNYTLKIANGGVAGTKFGIGTGNATYGVANDALNHAEDGYVPYTVTAAQMSFIVPGAGTMLLGTDGNLTVPNEIHSAAGVGPVVIQSNDGTLRTWTFGSDGNLTLPGGLPGTTSIINSRGFGSIGADGSSSIAWTDSDSNPTQISAVTADGNIGVVIQAGAVAGGPPVPDYQWTFGTDGTLTLPGDIYGPATHDFIHPDQVNGHALCITPASDAPTKKFNFRIDQYGEPFTRAYLEMPPAEVDKQVAISFPHTNGTIGYIFTQGANTYDDGMNNAFNLLYNSGDIKLTAEGIDGLKTWKFGNDGILTLPNGTRIKDTGVITYASQVNSKGFNSTIGTFATLNLVYSDPAGVKSGWIVNGPGVTNAIVDGTDTLLKSVSIELGHGNEFQDGESYTFTNLPFNDTGSTITVNNNDWTFKADGVLKFPDGGSLRVSTPPASSIGASGDKLGMVAFNGDYIYYCKQDYSAVLSTIVLTVNSIRGPAQNAAYTNNGGGYGTMVGFDGPLTGLASGQTFVYNTVTYTIQDVSNTSGEYAVIVFSPQMDAPTTAGITVGTQFSISTGLTQPDIWVRSAWTSTTW